MTVDHGLAAVVVAAVMLSMMFFFACACCCSLLVSFVRQPALTCRQLPLNLGADLPRSRLERMCNCYPDGGLSSLATKRHSGLILLMGCRKCVSVCVCVCLQKPTSERTMIRTTNNTMTFEDHTYNDCNKHKKTYHILLTH